MNTNMTGFRWFSCVCVPVLWMKVASALEGLSSCLEFQNRETRGIEVDCFIDNHGLQSTLYHYQYRIYREQQKHAYLD